MSRLTELIDIDGMKIKTSKERPLSNQGLGEILWKLYELEDLEEELGCPLDVVFKALKTNIWNDKTKRQEWVVLDYSNHEFVLKTIKELYIDDCKSILSLKDYGKTWWLKGDKE